MKEKDVAVTFITHKSDLNDYEKTSVERCFSVFKNRDIILGIRPEDIYDDQNPEMFHMLYLLYMELFGNL